jgi:hypothetical protein
MGSTMNHQTYAAPSPEPVTSRSASLTGTVLSFSRSGRHFAAIEPDMVVLFDLARSTSTRVKVGDARTLACFDDQIWIAARDQLVRVDFSGCVLGAERLSTNGEFFVPAPCGPAAAVWTSSPSITLLDDFGRVIQNEIVGADFVVPMTGRRYLIACGAKLVLPSRAEVPLAPGTKVLGGVIALDAKAAVLLTAQAMSRSLVTVSLGQAQITQSMRVPAVTVRVASRTMRVVAHVEPRTLLVVDPRGRELGSVEFDHDVHDFAIDPDGTSCAIRGPDDRVEVHELARLLDAKRPPVPVAQTVADVEPELTRDDLDATAAPWSSPETLATIQSPPELHIPPLLALVPREPIAPLDCSLALTQLDRECRGVGLRTLAAIACAWDTGRLGYGNKGRHPFELEVSAILGMSKNHAADHVAAAAEQLQEHERAIAADPEWRSARTPIGALAAEFGLTARAVDIMLVVAAPALHGEIARLFGILVDDDARACVDEMLITQVLGERHSRYEIVEDLDPRAPLVRLGIVRVSPVKAPPFATLTIDPVVLQRIRGMPSDLGDSTSIRQSRSPIGDLDIPHAVLQGAVESLGRSTSEPLRIMVRGRTGSGRTTLLAALCAHANRVLSVIDARALPRSEDAFTAALSRALCRAQLAGTVPCVSALDDVAFGEATAREVSAEALRRHPGPIAVTGAPDAIAPFPPGHVSIDLPALGEHERRSVWREALEQAEVRVHDLDVLVARYRVGPGVVRRAAAAARDVGSTDDATAACEAYIRQTRDTRLSKFAKRVERLASWSSIVLPPDILDSLRELVARVRHGRIVYEQWGMSRVLATSRGLTTLFQGPPGTGKTLVAGVIARELGLDLYQVDLSKVMSKWIGETERNLSTIFDAAEDGQVVLLFDEADSLFAKRTEVRSSNDRYANLEVNYLLQRLDAFEGIAILTTNSGTSIDQAFKRRMSFRLSFPFPDEDTRERLWRAHLPPELPIAGTLALSKLAHKYQISGGYIRNVCVRAAFLAAQEETAVSQDHLERAVALEYAEFGALSASGTIA